MNYLLTIVFVTLVSLNEINSQALSLNEMVAIQYVNLHGTPYISTEPPALANRALRGETEAERIGRLFTTSSSGINYNTEKIPASEIKSVTTELPYPPGEPCSNGICVPFRLCNNNSLITDGNGIITPRFNTDLIGNECHYLESCCARKDLKVITKPTIPQFNPQYQCGYRNIDGIGFRITDNDNEAQYAEFPWMVAVLVQEEFLEKLKKLYKCGGSLIHPRVVLTAAHCSKGKTADKIKVRAGEWDIKTTNEIFPHQDRDVVEIIEHENYYRGGLHNDIALLILTNQFDLAENVNTACLPPQNLGFEGSRCFATGWGKDVNALEGKYQVILKKVELPIVSNPSCQTSLRTTAVGPHFLLHDSFICAGGEPGKDTCKGDGGSPLVCPIFGFNNRYYQTGIVSWGMGCGENQIPGVYANVALFRNWIDEKFRIKEFETSYYST